MTGEKVKEILKSKGKVFGTLIESVSNPRQLEYFVKIGMDFVFIDNEHNPLDRNQTANICSIFSSNGIAPLVRIPKPDPLLAAMAVDGGAHGVIAPYVETVKEAWDVVGAVKYRPLKGKMLEELKNTGRYPSVQSRKYIEELNKNAVVVIMIESKTGMENLEKILDVPMIDVVFIGPNDFSISLGIPDMYEHELFINETEKVLDLCRKRGVGFGVHHCTYELHDYWINKGQNFTVYSSDTYLAYSSLRNGLMELKKEHSQEEVNVIT